jgi:glucose/arabinose dehydrogenase
MRRQVTCLILSALLAGCATTAEPTPTGQPHPTATLPPTPGATPTLTPGATPTTTPRSGATPTAAAGAIALEPFADGLASPVFITPAGDGSGLLYVVEQAGVIRVVGADGSVAPAPFLDIVDRIASGGERGLLGLAFHPDYASNGRFFVNYTDLNGDTVISEFTRSADGTVDPAAERKLLGIAQPAANHNGGMVAFGPDGALYVGMGDGGSQANGQNPDSLLSKMLHLDVDAVGGAPTVGIWDSGFRNPWRWSFDRQTGDLFVGDVGSGRWEEIDAEPAGTGGRNYGWNIMEGPDCATTTNCDQAGLTLPVAWHATHADGGCAITGGYVYRGAAIPDLVGTYLFSDYCAGIVWGFDAATAIAGGPVEPIELARSGLNVASFGQDEAGELYLVDHSGSVVRLTAGPATLP